MHVACLLTTHIPRTDRQGLPDFTTLSSNNPFRKFSAIPGPYNNSLPSPEIAECRKSAVGPERPQSRNPFLDQTDFKNFGGSLPTPGSPGREMPRSNGNTSIVKNEGYIGNAVDLFVRSQPNGIPLKGNPSSILLTRWSQNNLTMNHNKLHTNGLHHAHTLSGNYRHFGSENVPPPIRDRTGPTGHRPYRSQEQEERMRHGVRSRPLPNGLDNVFADPSDNGHYRRLRRNSESSIADKSAVMSDLEDERRKREQRHRDREAWYRGRPQTAKPKRPNQRLDLIDQLDVTSIYGTGCRWHSSFLIRF